MDASSRHLIFHGAIVLLFGLLCGAPYARAIRRNAPAHIVHAWRVAHLSLPIGAAVMLAVAAVLSSMTAGAGVKWLIAISLIVSSYAFCLSLPLGATVGQPGLSAEGPLAAKLVYASNLLGAWASALGSAVFIYAAYVSL